MQINKTDQNDAEGLAQIMRTGWFRSVHVKSFDSHRARALLGARAQMVGMTTRLSNNIRGVLKVFGMMSLARCSMVFTTTDLMLGRDAASLIAAASLRSFLPRLTNGLTYCGGIRRTRCPMLVKHTGPVVRSAASLKNHIHWRQLAKKCISLAALKLAPQNRPLLLIHAMQRENMFRRINCNALTHAQLSQGC